MNYITKGTICGIIAAISYGTNPLGALSLYSEGVNVNSVLFYRYFIAAMLLLFYILIKKESLRINMKELKVLASLGILFAVSSLSLFTSFHYMDAGVASTILFVYPIMVAIIMATFFKERISAITSLSIAMALSGIGLLYNGSGGETLSTVGIILVMVSSLTYAFYIIIVNKAELNMSALKLTFYVLLFATFTIVVYSFKDSTNQIQILTTPSSWLYALMLALVPTIISLVTMTIAVKLLGSTPTAIMGALEPLTAVIIGVTVFGETLTARLTLGILLILIAVILIIVGKSINIHKAISPFKNIRLRLRH